MHAYNCDEWINVYCRFFHTVKILKINVILNYFWLHAVNSEINWKKQVWWYLINSEQISIISLKEFALKMKKIKQIFTIMLLSSTKIDQFTQIILLRELINFQNVVVIKKKSMSFLYESAVHYINMKNQKISYRPLYNLFLHKLRILCEYLNDALIKDWIQYNVSSAESLILFIFKKDENLQLCVNY